MSKSMQCSSNTKQEQSSRIVVQATKTYSNSFWKITNHQSVQASSVEVRKESAERIVHNGSLFNQTANTLFLPQGSSPIKDSIIRTTNMENRIKYPPKSHKPAVVSNGSPGPSFEGVGRLQLERYNLRDGKAYVLIFHHTKFLNDCSASREGSEKDLALLKKFFTKYRVKSLDICENYTVDKVRKKMADISKKNFSSICCLLVIIMSHGDSKDLIKARDGMFNLEEEIVELTLLNDTLKNKPKIFIIQACKGRAVMETDAIRSATNKNDIMKCFSTYEGTAAFRDPLRGTFFIQGLFSLIEENGDKDLKELMTLLRKKFIDERFQQVPTDMSTLTKKFYFRDLKLN
ncbi:caspase-14-like [Topomyia yanbarensis]|uniref:caspase-14-like n=1 Tax=Topomyia yanbarensis TaxID=2498891 RepID=UPI00273CD092|nr:caspase-14-like [Topomyia yanbarensis]